MVMGLACGDSLSRNGNLYSVRQTGRSLELDATKGFSRTLRGASMGAADWAHERFYQEVLNLDPQSFNMST